MALADVDNDGDLDLLTANATQNGTVSIQLNNGQGGFTAVANLAVGAYPAHLATADLNGDGSLDLLVANAGSNSVSVRLNSGRGGVVASQEVPVGQCPVSVAAADIDGDGDLDLATADANGNTVSVRFNQAATPSDRSAQVQTDAPAASSASPLYPLVEGHLLSQLLSLPPATAPTAEAAEFSAYPNPLARATTVRFAAVQAGPVQVRVYNALGQLVATLYDGPLAAGQVLERPLDAAGLSAGVYTCRLSGPGPARAIKLIVNP